jgi:hypothetical protein
LTNSRVSASCACNLPPQPPLRNLLLPLHPHLRSPRLLQSATTKASASARRPHHSGNTCCRPNEQAYSHLPPLAARVARSRRSRSTKACSPRSCRLRPASMGSCLRAQQLRPRSWDHSRRGSNRLRSRLSRPGFNRLRLHLSLPVDSNHSRRVFSHLWLHSRQVSSHRWLHNRLVSSPRLHHNRLVTSPHLRHNLQASVSGHRLGEATYPQSHPSRHRSNNRTVHLASYRPLVSDLSSLHWLSFVS